MGGKKLKKPCSCLLPLKSVMATDVITTSSAAPPDEGSVVNPRPVSLEHTGNGGREEGRINGYVPTEEVVLF